MSSEPMKTEGKGGLVNNLRGTGLIVKLAFSADPWRATGSFLLASAQAGSVPILPVWLGMLTNGVLESDGTKVLLASLGYGVTLIALGLASYTGWKLTLVLQEKTSFVIDQRIIKLTSDLPRLEHHERPDYQNEVQLLRLQRDALGQTVQSLVYNFSNLIGLALTVAILARVNPLLLFLFAFTVPSLLTSGLQVSLGQKAMEKTVELSRLSRHLYETGTTAGPAKELRIFGLGEEIAGRHQRAWREVDRVSFKAAMKGSAISTTGWLIFAVGYVGGIYIVVQDALAGAISVGAVVTVLGLAAQLNQQLSQTVWMFGWFLQTLKTVGRFVWLLNYAKKATPVIADPVPAPDQITRGIEVKGVSFAYPGTSKPVLQDVNLFIPAGATVAIVGENGAGKTTLVKLLCRFYEPTEGVITVDGVDLSKMEFAEWRARLSGGFQDFAKYEFIAQEVVGVGDVPRIDQAEVVNSALNRASASDVITTLPKGLQSQLGKSFDEGVELSVGQWQKLALGRAMMRDAPLLLVLDEPTASLDAQTEHALFEQYAGAADRVAAANGAITVLVSHRFSTVRMADLIIVVADGRIQEAGSHRDLVNAGGLYAELYELQARSYR